MTHPSPKDVELYLRKALPTGDSITMGPLAAAIVIDQKGRGELAVAAGTLAEQTAAMGRMLMTLLVALGERLGRSPSDIALWAARDVLAYFRPEGGGGDEGCY